MCLCTDDNCNGDPTFVEKLPLLAKQVNIQYFYGGTLMTFYDVGAILLTILIHYISNFLERWCPTLMLKNGH